MKLKNKKKQSFQNKTLFYLLGFNVGIIILFWLLQIMIFDFYYRKYQLDMLTKTINNLENVPEEDIITALEDVAYNNDVCITVTDGVSNVWHFNMKMEGCALRGNNQSIQNMISSFINSNDTKKTFNFINDEMHISAVMSSLKYHNKYIFLYSNLKDISMVTTVIRKQLLYLSIMAAIIAIVISVFLSRKLTNPIKKITDKARLLGKGNYDIEFAESDISEIDDLSKTLKEAKIELSKTDELRRDLMANVSHDLKTPLTMIKAYAEMIKDISYKDKKKMGEHLDIIIDETDRLTLLVNDILDLSRLQAGKGEEFQKEKFDLAKEIKQIMKKYEIIKETEKYKFVLDMPEKIIIEADKKRINQVIYNLINNAINYTGKDKMVTIKVTKIKKEYKVEIIDTGKGINKEEIPYIWDKYYKNEKKHQRNVVSTGLGLSIVKEILEEHHFKYGVDSQENKGTSFYFYIPEK